MHLAIVSDEVDHQVEGVRVSIDEIPVTFLMECVSTREHGFQCTTLHSTERGLPYREVLLPTDVELEDLVVKRLYLFDLELFLLPCILFSGELLPFIVYFGELVLDLSYNLLLALQEILDLLVKVFFERVQIIDQCFEFRF